MSGAGWPGGAQPPAFGASRPEQPAAEPGPALPSRLTPSGLPMRTPSTQPFPSDLPAVTAPRPGDQPVQNPFFGTVQLPSSTTQTPQAPAPDWIRGRLNRLYEGVQHARDGQRSVAADSDVARPAAPGGDMTGNEAGDVPSPAGSP